MYRTYFVLPLFLAAAAGAVEQRDTVDSITSDIGGGFGQATSVAGSIVSVATDAASDVFTKVTSIGGEAVTLISTAGGEVFTLASDGFGTVTSIGGHAYTIATDAAGSAATAASSVVHNDARSLQPWSISVPLVSSLTAIVGGLAAGAWVAL